ncbi:PREDICTED: ZZ-type zinc finger-containing protein 3 [Dinoponera quadriceps]|uniref:ZZ-type zinc finger-containing protein 3 n=1 Tax=Dinoponera quadriceps TaxID=609295 RepID=A0A6P3X1N8_DINQU|nr:PREDICTED: ZZ-type zinc finger-containing protein 3 [Dinoponera quadriceps]XP_014471795.1 PREDICTED: ZZ-type zinc finger-containing protein 3 [Dinoponera quadriceps]
MNDEDVKRPDEEESEFGFETEHVALKGNTDYCAFLKTIVTLEAQRTRAIEDLDKLLSVKTKALKDPILFVAQLQNGDLPELPGPQKIAEIPYVDWPKYNISIPDVRMRPQTRHGNVLPQIHIKNEQEDGKILVRGRAFDESKPETFNQLWTNEEQKRLEELLVEYPQEEIEMKRWTKIAKALGNRTPKQVSSRVQKYFIKLSRAGLPIPGRGPKVKIDIKKGLTHKRNSNFLWKRSTFFPHQDISCGISDENKEQPVAEEFEEDTINEGMNDNPELRQIELLRQVKIEKEQDSSTYKNIGFKCTICDDEPIKGTRWQCAECSDTVLCGDCAVTQLEEVNPMHNPYHKLLPIKPPCTRSYDLDYLPQCFNNSYNYLDPNFLPE